MFENPRRGRQARNFTTNVPKILVLKSSSEQIFSRKLPLGARGIRARPIWNYRPDCWIILLHSVLLPSLIVETNFKAKPLQFAKKVQNNSFSCCFSNSKSGVNSANKNNCYCQWKYYPLIRVIVTLPQRKITSFWS